MQVTDLVKSGLAHGRIPFDDIFTADAALEAAKIQIIYAATADHSPEVLQATRDNIEITLRFFQTVHLGQSGRSQYASSPSLARRPSLLT